MLRSDSKFTHSWRRRVRPCEPTAPVAGLGVALASNQVHGGDTLFLHYSQPCIPTLQRACLPTRPLILPPYHAVLQPVEFGEGRRSLIARIAWLLGPVDTSTLRSGASWSPIASYGTVLACFRHPVISRAELEYICTLAPNLYLVSSPWPYISFTYPLADIVYK